MDGSAKSNRFGEPAPMLVSTPLVAISTTVENTTEGEAVGAVSSTSAATPATWGAAIDVPLRKPAAVLLLLNADITAEPGANKSTHGPTFEYEDLAS